MPLRKNEDEPCSPGKTVLYFIWRGNESDQISGGAWSALQILKHLRKYRPHVIVNQHDLFSDQLERAKIPFDVLPLNDFARTSKVAGIVQRAGRLFGLTWYNIRFWRTIAKIN